MKKFISLFLCISVILALVVSCFAEEVAPAIIDESTLQPMSSAETIITYNREESFTLKIPPAIAFQKSGSDLVCQAPVTIIADHPIGRYAKVEIVPNARADKPNYYTSEFGNSDEHHNQWYLTNEKNSTLKLYYTIAKSGGNPVDEGHKTVVSCTGPDESATETLLFTASAAYNPNIALGRYTGIITFRVVAGDAQPG